MASGGEQVSVDEQYICPICCEVFKSPVVIRTCGHTFCGVCIEQILPGPAQTRTCPVCRVGFITKDLRQHSLLQQEIASAVRTCTSCGIRCRLSDWDDHIMTAHPHIPTQHVQRRGPPTSNRSTFKCPLCPQQHLSCPDLLAHVNSLHPHSRIPVVCPVCSSMPWGVPDQLSQNFVAHLNTRHKFEYDTYVDYNADEEAVLLATIQASLTDK